MADNLYRFRLEGKGILINLELSAVAASLLFDQVMNYTATPSQKMPKTRLPSSRPPLMPPLSLPVRKVDLGELPTGLTQIGKIVTVLAQALRQDGVSSLDRSGLRKRFHKLGWSEPANWFQTLSLAMKRGSIVLTAGRFSLTEQGLSEVENGLESLRGWKRRGDNKWSGPVGLQLTAEDMTTEEPSSSPVPDSSQSEVR